MVSRVRSTPGDTASQHSVHCWETLEEFAGHPHIGPADPAAQRPSLGAIHCSGTFHTSSAGSVSIHRLIPHPLLLLLKRHGVLEESSEGCPGIGVDLTILAELLRSCRRRQAAEKVLEGHLHSFPTQCSLTRGVRVGGEWREGLLFTKAHQGR